MTHSAQYWLHHAQVCLSMIRSLYYQLCPDKRVQQCCCMLHDTSAVSIIHFDLVQSSDLQVQSDQRALSEATTLCESGSLLSTWHAVKNPESVVRLSASLPKWHVRPYSSCNMHVLKSQHVKVLYTQYRLPFINYLATSFCHKCSEWFTRTSIFRV